jgi:hypothetical protein
MSEQHEHNIAKMEAKMAEAERCYLQAIPDATAQRAFSYAYRSAWNHQQAKIDAKDRLLLNALIALEYQTEQTRPIESVKRVIAQLREARIGE